MDKIKGITIIYRERIYGVTITFYALAESCSCLCGSW